MKKSDRKDGLGDRMKLLEFLAPGGGIFIPELPIVCRMDGRNFSNWTKGLRRPYDGRLSRLMIETTKMLVTETGATVGYTQSDEITLVLYAKEYDTQLYFGSKIFKILSHLGGMTGDIFNALLPDLIPEKVREKIEHESSCYYAGTNLKNDLFPPTCNCNAWKRNAKISGTATFDARAFNTPNLNQACNAVLWREIDATRNSVTMLAQSVYSHKDLQGKKRSEKMDMLMEKGINWNDEPAFFKRGTYCRRVVVDGEKRSKVMELSLEPLRSYPHEERVRLLFGGE